MAVAFPIRLNTSATCDIILHPHCFLSNQRAFPIWSLWIYPCEDRRGFIWSLNTELLFFLKLFILTGFRLDHFTLAKRSDSSKTPLVPSPRFAEATGNKLGSFTRRLMSFNTRSALPRSLQSYCRAAWSCLLFGRQNHPSLCDEQA